MTAELANRDVPVAVHIVGHDPGSLPAAAAPPVGKPPAYHRMAARSFTLTAADPVQQILPLAPERIEAYVITQTNDVTIGQERANVQSGGNLVATIPHNDTAPFPLNTNDAVWATAAVLPTTVSVVAIYREASGHA